MTDLPPFRREDTALTLIALNYAHTRIGKALAAARAAYTEHLQADERTAAVAYGVKLGMATRTKDRKVAVVEDEAALWSHLDDTETGALVDQDALVAGGEDEAIAVLKEHAPHLVTTSVVAKDWAIQAALSRAMAGESVPGVRVDTRPGTTNLYPEKGHEDLIGRLIREGVVSIDGTVNRLIEQQEDQS